MSYAGKERRNDYVSRKKWITVNLGSYLVPILTVIGIAFVGHYRLGQAEDDISKTDNEISEIKRRVNSVDVKQSVISVDVKNVKDDVSEIKDDQKEILREIRSISR